MSEWIIILAVIGMIIALYIGVTKSRNKKVACIIDGSGCNKVLDSKWSRTFGIRNEWIGLLYYIIIIISTIILTNNTPIIKLASVLALLYSLVLTVIQVKMLKHYCLYCLLSALVNLGLFILIIS